MHEAQLERQQQYDPFEWVDFEYRDLGASNPLMPA